MSVIYVNIGAKFGPHRALGELLSQPHSLRQALRAATREEHEALEAQPLMRRLVSSTLTLTEYRQIVRAQRAFYAQLEPEVMPFERALRRRLPEVGYRYYPRLPALEQDCRHLHLPADEVIQPAQELFRPQSPEETLGVLYVLEGASQGGRVILRRLDGSLGLSGDNGASFFNSYAEHDSWPLLCRWLDELPAREPWVEALVGAQRTFNGLKAHFDHWQRQQSDR